MKLLLSICAFSRLSLISILIVLCNTPPPLVAHTTDFPHNPNHTTYLERRIGNVIEHFIIIRHPEARGYDTVLQVTANGAKVLDALPPLSRYNDYLPPEPEHDNFDIHLNASEKANSSPDQNHHEKEDPRYCPQLPASSRFSVLSPYMAEKLSLATRAQEQARQRMLHASHTITPSYYQKMLLEGNIKEVKAALAILQHKYSNTRFYQLLTWPKLRNKINDIKRVLQKDHAQCLDTIATGTKQQARDLILGHIEVDNPDFVPIAIKYKEAQYKIYRERVTDWAQEFLNNVNKSDIAGAKQRIQEWAQWNFADPISNNIARAFLTYADDAYQNKCRQHKEDFLARVATEGIDPVLNTLDAPFEDTIPAIVHSKWARWSTQNKQHSPSDVTQRFMQMLRPGDDRLALATSVQTIADDIFTAARQDGKYIVSQVIDHAYYLIEDIKTCTDDTRLMFTIAMADNLLCDIQNQSAGNAYDSTPSFLERSRSLLSHAAQAFAGRFNPVTRVKESIDFFSSTARFVSTITAGKWYLSDSEYKNRINDYWDTFNALSFENLSQLSAEQLIGIGASIAGDIVLGMGITKTARYLKEIQAVVKAQKKAADIAKKLKRAVTNSLKENPIAITPGGKILRVSMESDNLVTGGGTVEIIKSAEEIYESFCKGHMAKIAADIDLAERMYKNTRKGFAECSNQFIKPDYKHILGLDHSFCKKGKPQLGGFHFDRMCALENSRIIQFTHRIEKNGFYKSKLWYNGNYLKDCTFFPADWEAHEVIGCIMGAYDKFKASGAMPTIDRGGKYLIEVTLQNGVDMRMHITKNGVLRAYPVIR